MHRPIGTIVYSITATEATQLHFESLCSTMIKGKSDSFTAPAIKISIPEGKTTQYLPIFPLSVDSPESIEVVRAELHKTVDAVIDELLRRLSMPPGAALGEEIGP